MYNIKLGKTDLSVPTIAVGCMRISKKNEKEIKEFVNTALENGANFFDHADIYGGGESEKVFAKAITPSMREKVIIQTKCGIVPGKMFDFSYEHIIESVNGSLKRLNTDYIDVLLLHRPDTLMEPEEVAKAFDELKSQGKVLNFGVSNQNPPQMELLQRAMDMPICANQLQLSVMHSTIIQSGFNANMYNESAVNRDYGVLDYCRLKEITIQPWSPLQFGFFKSCFIDNPEFPEVNAKLEEIAKKHGVTKTGIAFAWLLRHPAKMQPVTGTSQPSRLVECLKGAEVKLTREEWYEIYMSAGNKLP